jgi:hypothetical protein
MVRQEAENQPLQENYRRSFPLFISTPEHFTEALHYLSSEIKMQKKMKLLNSPEI